MVLLLLVVGCMSQAWEVMGAVAKKVLYVVMLSELNSDSSEHILFSVPCLPKHQAPKLACHHFPR